MNFTINTTQKQELLDITDKVNEILQKSKAKTGICNVFVTHATAAIIINENHDPNICIDLLNALNKSFPDNAGYLHDRIDGNAGAHIKAAILGPGETIPIENNKLKLGTWQSLMLVELDGPRTDREIQVIILEQN
ncbi:MAG: secondary thiamine-phosphate synthase enzyme YjbQ [Nanoarchaeota archaeon]|nr:secondary thiamine-phosphate synthase enzyme YjbQ [Nanoarchaeota archaeon]MBU1322298.1 secondary thiamine-phosphate synthase enzyme YjbQ [Nanoarchaeota archaeon]MBU1597837.1 secondary thiamine-phosphate synthase enzyme YjbQ [Nanoarchaeota archaeon]MBU2441090.1 secondary thiamine-phosphate synthase enzyme YjbQ [Nanoarchaeota archaeon]